MSTVADGGDSGHDIGIWFPRPHRLITPAVASGGSSGNLIGMV